MSVDPQAQILLSLMAKRPPVDPADMPAAEYRALIEKLSRSSLAAYQASLLQLGLPAILK